MPNTAYLLVGSADQIAQWREESAGATPLAIAGKYIPALWLAIVHPEDVVKIETADHLYIGFGTEISTAIARLQTHHVHISRLLKNSPDLSTYAAQFADLLRSRPEPLLEFDITEIALFFKDTDQYVRVLRNFLASLHPPSPLLNPATWFAKKPAPITPGLDPSRSLHPDLLTDAYRTLPKRDPHAIAHLLGGGYEDPLPWEK